MIVVNLGFMVVLQKDSFISVSSLLPITLPVLGGSGVDGLESRVIPSYL